MIFVLLCGCGPKAPPQKAVVGGACKAVIDCQDGLFCETRVPGGVCTMDCTPPAQSACPPGSRCVNVVVDVIAESAYRCLEECNAAHACRTDTLWSCRSTGDFSVCAPGGG